MNIFLMIVHVMIVLCLIGSILIQSSDSNAFGTSSSSNFMSVRSSANFLVRCTAVLAFMFFMMCMFLSLLSRYDSIKNRDDIRKAIANSAKTTSDSSAQTTSGSNVKVPSSHPRKKSNPPYSATKR